MVIGASRPTLRQEQRLWRAGHRWVAGMDEVGRGAWAGPVSVGVAVAVPSIRSSSLPAWLRDSKQLAEQRREGVFDEVARWCADGAVGHASAAECDRWGMTAALRLAAYRALGSLELRPHAIVVDGPMDLLRARALPEDRLEACLRCFGTPIPAVDEMLSLPPVDLPDIVLPVIDADQTCAVVAAASVLAKVVRDRIMRSEAQHFPAYDFDRNKGYPSPTHQIALRGYGLSAIHRRSWAFVDDLPFGA
jgi:ribonuclease HII